MRRKLARQRSQQCAAIGWQMVIYDDKQRQQRRTIGSWRGDASGAVVQQRYGGGGRWRRQRRMTRCRDFDVGAVSGPAGTCRRAGPYQVKGSGALTERILGCPQLLVALRASALGVMAEFLPLYK
ncbi:hypothetical protein Scep_015050 [Stephania cephalantha]|uniref:Uncharacterized protein n=1 Tax=Stephania cephalantha TaxID=152367 RepID=A0AAP0P118_9MAGN